MCQTKNDPNYDLNSFLQTFWGTQQPRQYFRLSICSYFGWVWQILSEWYGETSRLVYSSQPAESQELLTAASTVSGRNQLSLMWFSTCGIWQEQTEMINLKIWYDIWCDRNKLKMKVPLSEMLLNMAGKTDTLTWKSECYPICLCNVIETNISLMFLNRNDEMLVKHLHTTLLAPQRCVQRFQSNPKLIFLCSPYLWIDTPQS